MPATRLVRDGDLVRGNGRITTLFLDFRVPGQDNIAPVTEPVTIQCQEDLAQMSDWPDFTNTLISALVRKHGPNGITVVVSRQTMTIHTAPGSDVEYGVNRALETREFVLAPKAENIIPGYSEPAPEVSRHRPMTYADWAS